MKVKVTRKFQDKYTKKTYKVGDILDITEQRFEEIKSVDTGLVEKVAERTRNKKDGDE